MSRPIPHAVMLAVVLAFGGPIARAQVPDTVLQAVAFEGRPDADRARDAQRAPAETLAFAGVTPGLHVGEYMPGAGYFTRILARAVGPEGTVYAFQPAEIVRLRPAYLTEIEAVAAEPGMGNVTVVSEPNPAFGAGERFDLVFTAQNYHDLHGPFAPEGAAARLNAAILAALKPGGILVVIDHHAAAGTGLTGAADLHRIERDVVVAELEGAGFVLEAESDLLSRPEDPRTANVFDPSIRGRTDQFLLRFRKPD